MQDGPCVESFGGAALALATEDDMVMEEHNKQTSESSSPSK